MTKGLPLRRKLTGMVVVAALLPFGVSGAQEEGLIGTPSTEAQEERGPLRLEVDLSERRLRAYEGDEVVREYDVAVGTSANPTPQGRFQIRRVIWNPRWVPPNAAWARGKTAKGPGEPGNPMGRAKLFFQEPDYYIHGTENEASLGRAESHGCVRMANGDVVELARLVMERGGQPRPPTWYQRILNVVRSSSEVRLSEPVTVIVAS